MIKILMRMGLIFKSKVKFTVGIKLYHYSNKLCLIP